MKILSLLILMMFAAGCKSTGEVVGEWDVPKDKEKLHIFLTMGQSNMGGYGRILPEDRQPVPHVIHLPTKYKGELQWQPAAHPINNRLPKTHRFGLQIPFAKAYLKDKPGVKVALIPVAWGGAQINRLKKGTGVYADAIKKAKWAQQFGVIKGVLWHQGESDTVNDKLSGAYESKLHQLIKDIRSDLNSPKLPFIAGNLAEFYGNGRSAQHNKGITIVKNVLRSLPEKVKNTGFVESNGLKSIDRHDVHFDREAYLIFGKRYNEVYKQLVK